MCAETCFKRGDCCFLRERQVCENVRNRSAQNVIGRVLVEVCVFGLKCTRPTAET